MEDGRRPHPGPHPQPTRPRAHSTSTRPRAQPHSRTATQPHSRTAAQRRTCHASGQSMKSKWKKMSRQRSHFPVISMRRIVLVFHRRSLSGGITSTQAYHCARANNKQVFCQRAGKSGAAAARQRYLVQVGEGEGQDGPFKVRRPPNLVEPRVHRACSGGGRA